MGDDETFSQSLMGREIGLEVKNLSVQGYGTDQELLVLLHVGLSYRPDVVLLTFCIENDFLDNENSRFIYDSIHVKPYFTLSEGTLVLHDEHLRVRGLRRLLLWLNDESALFNWLLLRVAAKPEIFRQGVVGNNEPLKRKFTAATTLAILKQIKVLAESNDSEFILLIVPPLYLPQHNVLTQMLLEAREMEEIVVIDAGKHFFERGPRDQFYLHDGIHLSPQGHRAVADLIYAELSRLQISQDQR